MTIDNLREVTSLLELLLEQLRSGLVIDSNSSNVALETTLNDILTELGLKADLTDKQPTKLYIDKDGTDTALRLDTTNPYTNVPLPVVITDVNGSSVVNIDAGDLNVNIVHDGTDPSSVRIGDGTDLMVVNSDGSLNIVGDITKVGGNAVSTLGSQKAIPVALYDSAGGQITSFGSPSTISEYKSPNDFTATYTSNVTITLVGLSFTPTSEQIVYIRVIPTSGSALMLVNGSGGVTMKYSAGVITISGAGTPFAAGDLYEVGINGVKKAYNSVTDTIKTTVSNADWGSKYNTVIPIIGAAQTLTTSFVDLGSGFEIPCMGYKTLAIWIKLTIQQSVGVQIQALAKHTSAGSEEYNLPIETISATLVQVNPEIVQFPDANGLFLLKIALDNVIPYVQLQIKMTTDGGTDGTIDTAYYTLGY